MDVHKINDQFKFTAGASFGSNAPGSWVLREASWGRCPKPLLRIGRGTVMARSVNPLNCRDAATPHADRRPIRAFRSRLAAWRSTHPLPGLGLPDVGGDHQAREHDDSGDHLALPSQIPDGLQMIRTYHKMTA